MKKFSVIAASILVVAAIFYSEEGLNTEGSLVCFALFFMILAWSFATSERDKAVQAATEFSEYVTSLLREEDEREAFILGIYRDIDGSRAALDDLMEGEVDSVYEAVIDTVARHRNGEIGDRMAIEYVAEAVRR